MRQIHSEAVTAGPDLTFAPASNFAAESPAALRGHRKILQMTLLCYITKVRHLYHYKGESRKYNRNLATLKPTIRRSKVELSIIGLVSHRLPHHHGSR